MIDAGHLREGSSAPFSMEDITDIEHALDTILVYVESRYEGQGDEPVHWDTMFNELDWLFDEECLEELVNEAMDRGMIFEPRLARLEPVE